MQTFIIYLNIMCNRVFADKFILSQLNVQGLSPALSRRFFPRKRWTPQNNLLFPTLPRRFYFPLRDELRKTADSPQPFHDVFISP